MHAHTSSCHSPDGMQVTSMVLSCTCWQSGTSGLPSQPTPRQACTVRQQRWPLPGFCRATQMPLRPRARMAARCVTAGTMRRLPRSILQVHLQCNAHLTCSSTIGCSCSQVVQLWCPTGSLKPGAAWHRAVWRQGLAGSCSLMLCSRSSHVLQDRPLLLQGSINSCSSDLEQAFVFLRYADVLQDRTQRQQHWRSRRATLLLQGLQRSSCRHLPLASHYTYCQHWGQRSQPASRHSLCQRDGQLLSQHSQLHHRSPQPTAQYDVQARLQREPQRSPKPTDATESVQRMNPLLVHSCIATRLAQHPPPQPQLLQWKHREPSWPTAGSSCWTFLLWTSTCSPSCHDPSCTLPTDEARWADGAITAHGILILMLMRSMLAGHVSKGTSRFQWTAAESRDGRMKLSEMMTHEDASSTAQFLLVLDMPSFRSPYPCYAESRHRWFRNDLMQHWARRHLCTAACSMMTNIYTASTWVWLGD